MAYTFLNISNTDAESDRSYWKIWALGFFLVLAAAFLHWGGYLLIARASAPEHVDAAVVLQGSVASEKAQIVAAIALLQRGSAKRVVISIPRESYWGEELLPVAQQYFEKNFGAELAGKVDFCATDPDMTSAEQEAQAVGLCIRDNGWKNILVMTSNYQSRRVEMVWRKTLPGIDPSVDVSVEGMADAGYQPRGWWRQRPYAEIWLKESAKLVWASL